MGCLKCGRDLDEGQVFCRECLKFMENHPVQPGTAVLLPKRREAPAFKKPPKRRAPSPEEQIRALKKRCRILGALLAAALLTCALLAVPAWEHLFGEHVLPGQNYSTVTSTVPQSG